MLKLACLCGQVRIEVAKRPDFIHECNCSLCGKTGARWGYFPPDEVRVDGASQGFCRPDKNPSNVEIHFCPTCGATTHFLLTEQAVAKFGNTVAGVNMWLADASELAGIELRFPDGRSWAGEGEFDYVREARIIE